VWTELIGWVSAFILLLTIGRQVYVQWQQRTTAGLSKWLFTGQIAASAGFIIYSILLSNWVFVTTNVLMIVTAALGQWLYVQNRKQQRRSERA
jgi:MtN3 and saliva related transmembrane protein